MQITQSALLTYINLTAVRVCCWLTPKKHTGTVGNAPSDEGNRSDAFAVRYSATGALVWQTRWGTAGVDQALGAASDVSDKLLYVVGSTSGAMGPAAQAPNTTASAGQLDVFLTCLSGVSGAIQWTRQFGTGADDTPVRVAVGARGGVYVTGLLGSPENPLEKTRVFIGRWDYLGNQQYLTRLNSSTAHSPRGLAIGSTSGTGEGTVYISGHTE